MVTQQEIAVLFPLLAAAGLALVGCNGLWNIHRMRRWPRVAGIVVGGHIEELTGGESETWLLCLEIRTQRGVVRPRAIPYDTKADAEQGRQAFADGTEVTLWWDRRSDVYFWGLPLDNENPFWPFAFAAFFVAVAVLESVGLWSAFVETTRDWLGPWLPTCCG